MIKSGIPTAQLYGSLKLDAAAAAAATVSGISIPSPYHTDIVSRVVLGDCERRRRLLLLLFPV